jgi:antitoxin MazE
MSVRASIVRIGNSHGVRIPKAFLEQCQLKGEVSMSVVRGALVLKPISKSQAGWAEAFAADPALEAADEAWSIRSTSQWDDDEWQWNATDTGKASRP